jgi:hypothetical protein
MTTEILVVVIAGAFTLLGVGIAEFSSWRRTKADQWKFSEELRHESMEKRKEWKAENRRPYLSVLRQTMAELLEVDREGAKAQKTFESLLRSSGGIGTETSEFRLARESAAKEFTANNELSNKVNRDLRKCLYQNGDKALDLLVNDVIKLSAELFGERLDTISSVSSGQADYSERLRKITQTSEQLLSKTQFVNSRIEQLLCGDD